MALANLSFKLYTDTSLTIPFSGTYQLTHETDLSDNPQDMVLYFGSTTSSAELNTTTNPGVNNITLTPTSILPVWSGSTAYAVGESVEPTVGNTYRYECTVAGTSAATQPTWPTTIGNTVVDGTVTWQCVSKRHEETEIKLATTTGGLVTATGGAALILGTTLTGGVANRTDIHMRITNAVTTAGSNGSTPEIGIDINDVTET